MTQQPDRSTSASWARFRFSVVGSLLSSPPARGELKAALRALAAKTWTHPVTGREVRFAAETIERWYYTARARAGRSRRRPATRRAQGLRQGLPGAGADRASAAAVPRPPALDLPVALRQPGRGGEGRSVAGAAPLVLHGPAVHAGPRPGAQAAAGAQGPPRRSAARRSAAKSARSAATKPSTSAPCGISTSTTAR